MIPKQHFSVVIVAGGKGLRQAEKSRSSSNLLAETHIDDYGRSLYNFDYRMRIVIVLPEEFRLFWEELCEKHNFRIPHSIVGGGNTLSLREKRTGRNPGRRDCRDSRCARPFIPKEVIGRCYREASDFHCGVIPVIEEKNSVRILTAYESKALDRKNPCGTNSAGLSGQFAKNAYETPYREEFTDDASVAEDSGIQIKLVEGDERNIKITTRSI